ncbi:melatonin receptor type 1B-B-like [Symsagittifera roscoffensis]|uniref:melatonin receptor type 1B-B-like n=1 Tax=Symsagittifera roscoffensis TaxID=84072 RepID=UPI00307B8922
MMNTTESEETFWEKWVKPLEDIDDPAMIRTRFFMIIWLCMALLLGIPGNLLVIASVAVVKNLRKLPHLFVINLAICDLGVMSMHVFVLIGAIYGDTFLKDRYVMCEVSGIVCMLSCFGSLWTMMFVAVNRYVFICQNQIYNKLFDLKGTVVALVLLWICVFLLDLPNYPWFGGHVFTELFLHCSFKIDSIRWWFNTLFYSVLALCVPMFTIMFCYYSIWRKANSASGIGKASEKRQKEQKQLVISLVTLFVAFCVTWLPYGILIALLGFSFDVGAYLPFEAIIMLDLWAHFNSSCNFIIYGVTHRGFRDAYLELLYKVIPCCKPSKVNEHTSNATGATTMRSQATTQM